MKSAPIFYESKNRFLIYIGGRVALNAHLHTFLRENMTI